MYPFNFKKGQVIQSNAPGVSADHFYGAHYHVPAAAAVAEADASVMALHSMDEAAHDVTAGLTNPAVPRNVKIKGNKAGLNTKVTVHGVNYANEVISEELTLNGSTAVAGSLAFARITKVSLPARTNVPAKQKATVVVGGAAAGAGNEVLTFISAATGAAFDVTVPFVAGDNSATLAAAKIVLALNADATFSAKWLAASSVANLTIESKTYAAQDATINLTVKTAGTPNVSLGAITVNTTAGVIEDQVSVGIGKKFGLPYYLPAAELAIVKLFNNSADTGTVTADADELEKNVIALNGTPDGLKPIDLYILV
jgi:hypothetical protein